MAVLEQALAVLQDAERKLRALASHAAREGHYDELSQVAGFARQLSALLMSSTVGGHDDSESVASDAPRHDEAQGLTDRLSVPTPVRREVRRGKYPRFVREDNDIVKVGWSKKTRAEYEHKASHDVVDAFAGKLVKTGRRFTMDDLLPLRLADGREVPAYQAYLSLAWLRACGLVRQHGRKGYSVPSRKDLEARVRAEWTRLSER